MKPELTSLISAFDRLADAAFTIGPDWQAAHNLCQANEGDMAFDWGHALCHRIEGDDWNAAYWYRRAGKPVAKASYSQEWAEMRVEIST